MHHLPLVDFTKKRKFCNKLTYKLNQMWGFLMLSITLYRTLCGLIKNRSKKFKMCFKNSNKHMDPRR